MISDEQIPYLICRKLIGTITAEEEALLEKWRQLNDSNSAAYGRMMQKERVDNDTAPRCVGAKACAVAIKVFSVSRT